MYIGSASKLHIATLWGAAVTLEPNIAIKVSEEFAREAIAQGAYPLDMDDKGNLVPTAFQLDTSKDEVQADTEEVQVETVEVPDDYVSPDISEAVTPETIG